jgi:hypothetical protein
MRESAAGGVLFGFDLTHCGSCGIRLGGNFQIYSRLNHSLSTIIECYCGSSMRCGTNSIQIRIVLIIKKTRN